jgi:hypothetical protein
MNERLRRRILAFYFAGAVNLVLGLYTLIEGPALVGRETTVLLVLFFFGFALVDFYFPRAMKKKWLEDQARQAAERAKREG